MDYFDIGTNLFHLLIFSVIGILIIKLIDNYHKYKIAKNREFYNIEYRSDHVKPDIKNKII